MLIIILLITFICINGLYKLKITRKQNSLAFTEGNTLVLFVTNSLIEPYHCL